MEARERILEAAFAAFKRSGYAAASTAEIAADARVSKRELYALVGNKRAMLVACIRDRATRLQLPADVPVPHDRESLAQVLTAFGTQLIREVWGPDKTGDARSLRVCIKNLRDKLEPDPRRPRHLSRR